MTHKQALQILIQHAAANVHGVGTGIRPGISDKQMDEVSRAVALLWPKAYGFPYGQSEAFNLGLHYLKARG